MQALAAEGRTVFVSSHLMSEMALTADHLIVIGRGRLLADTSDRRLHRRRTRPTRCGSARRSSERCWRRCSPPRDVPVQQVDGYLEVDGTDHRRRSATSPPRTS